MKIDDLRKSGHAPSLLAAFLHFDISFMIWVILGALMPFLMTDMGLTGANLLITPQAGIEKPGQYTLIIKGPQKVKDNPKLTVDQPKNVYNLFIKPGDPAHATRASVKPVEKFVVNNANPASVVAINEQSKYIRVEIAPDAKGNPNENVVALKPMAALSAAGLSAQPVATGYPASLKLTLIGVPLLAAGFWRLLLGGLSDRFGSKRVGMASLAITLIPLLIGYKFAHDTNAIYVIGFFLGVAGASFAVALPLASRWYPPHLQGLAMGIAGAGNSGTVLATIFAPLLAKSMGWQNVFGFLMIPVFLVFVAFSLLAKDPPAKPDEVKESPLAGYHAVLSQGDAWTLCLLYFVTFGGFVGLSSFFNTFFVDQYDAPKAAVGLWTWPFIIAGSFLRPVGGALSDKFGGVRVLAMLYAVCVLAAIGVGFVISNFWVSCVMLLILMGALGMGNGAVFQIVPQRFRKEIGVMTGLVGAAGGIGGYYLNFALGNLKDMTGTYASGFYAFAGIALVAVVTLLVVSPRWMQTWLGQGGTVAGTREQMPVLPVPATATITTNTN